MEKTSLEIGDRSAAYPSSEFSHVFQTIRRLRLALVLAGALLGLCVGGIIALSVIAASQQDDIDKLNDHTSLRLSRVVSNSDSNGHALYTGSGYWIEKTSLPFPRSDLQVIAVDDLIYVLGGLNSTNEVLDEVLVYDTVLDTYNEGPSLPIPLHRFAAEYDPANQKIYIYGGFSEVDGEWVDSLYVLDLKSGEWEELAKMTIPRSDHCGAFLDGMVYSIGGYGVNYTVLNSVEVYNPTTNEWKLIEEMPTPRGDCKAVAVGGKIVVLGGYYDAKGEWNPSAFRKDVEIYSPGSGVWEEGADLKYARGDKAVVALPNDRVLVMGGETDNRGQHTNIATHHVQEYSLEGNVWIEKAPLPNAAFRASAGYVDGIVYLFGGHTQCIISEDPDTPPDCSASGKVQVYYDFLHPSIFIL